MKNREKYRDEIITTAVNGTCCKFMLDKVMPNFIDNSVNVDSLCEDGNCSACSMLFSLWLDEEHEVDWSKVPVDTLVRVRDSKDEEWEVQYFKCTSETIPDRRFEAWGDGTTSKTTHGHIMHWKYCELVEDEGRW